MTEEIKIGIIGGTGMDQDPNLLQEQQVIQVPSTPYGDPSDTTVLSGRISGLQVFVLGRHGKNHDRNPSNVNYRANLWTFRELGCQIVLVTTACGSLKEEIAPGHFALLDQYIDRTKGCRETSFYSVSHIPQGKPFDPVLQEILAQSLETLGFTYHKNATCVTIEGPRFSSLAESRLYKSWGAEIVNMTTVPEAPLAAELGLLYGSLSLVTDYDCWHESEEEGVSVQLVCQRMQQLGAKARLVLAEAIKRISKSDLTSTITKKREAAKAAIMHA